MGSALSYIVNNWSELLFILTSIVTVASLIVKLTPNKSDDVIVGKILRFVNFLALNKKQNSLKVSGFSQQKK